MFVIPEIGSGTEVSKTVLLVIEVKHVHPVQNLPLCTKSHQNRMIFH